eukprot:451471-Pleurochrysis_carterae.AAC.1
MAWRQEYQACSGVDEDYSELMHHTCVTAVWLSLREFYRLIVLDSRFKIFVDSTGRRHTVPIEAMPQDIDAFLDNTDVPYPERL